MADRLAPSSRHAYRVGSQLVYEWQQSLSEVEVFVRVPPGTRARELTCTIGPSSLCFGINGRPPYLEAELAGAVKVSESFWTLEDGELHVTLCKREEGKAWRAVVAGHESALSEVDGEKETKRLMLERFQTEHPGFDFSGAEFSGACPDPQTFMGGIKKQ